MNEMRLNLVDLIAYEWQELAQALQAIASNVSINSAQGKFLDDLALLVGLTRQEDEADDAPISKTLFTFLGTNIAISCRILLWFLLKSFFKFAN